ncbi:cupin domain-containing protein [Ekhidna sp. MALMAid0563]|uniref:cupin domain-containing protein n=1 Tax=Ekhidna sp. MALMAid0563 TaxID=3143937 RepID=UPI0032DFA940
MITVDLNHLELNEFVGVLEKKQHCKATFPLIGAHGSKELATVYFEIAPGDMLGRHTDSAEELLIILEGEAEVEIGNESICTKKGSVALVPKDIPHNLWNIGSETLKVLGVFGGANNIVATFEEEFLPLNTNVVDTSQIE